MTDESLPDKITTYVESTRIECTDVFAVPGEHHIIDQVHPNTGRSVINGQTLEEIRERYPNAQRIAWEDWKQQQITRQQTPIQWSRVTDHEYQRMLEILPPAYWNTGGFLVGEPYDHCYATGRPRFQAYIERPTGKYRSSRPLTVQEYRNL